MKKMKALTTTLMVLAITLFSACGNKTKSTTQPEKETIVKETMLKK